MKMLKMILGCTVALLVLGTTACKKDNTTTGCGAGLVCATVDGVSYTAAPYNVSTTGGFFGIGGTTTYSGSYAELIPSSSATGGYNLRIVGNNGTPSQGPSYQFDMRVFQLPVQGSTYTSEAGSADFDYYAGSPSNQMHYVDSAHTGTITISMLDTVNNYVSGTFRYNVTEAPGEDYTPSTHSITGGTFTKLILRR